MLINAVDRLGRRIDPAVLAAAEEIAPRAVQYGEKLLRDSALATTLLEESAATVSRALALKRDGVAGIRNLQAYVFRAFLRRINRARRKDPILASVTDASFGADASSLAASEEFELKVLVDELLTRCDPVVRDMFYRRMQGFSWKEIARAHGTSAHAAESRFSQALRRVGKKMGLQR